MTVIKDLQPNKQVFTVPRALYEDSNGDLWLHTGYAFTTNSRKPTQMGVELVDGGYKVDISRRTHEVGSIWVNGSAWGHVGFDPQPVIELVK